ncbi:MAG: DUF2935 domain-containing protein [Eubacteriales bacterium]|jgi:hypothetical protein
MKSPQHKPIHIMYYAIKGGDVVLAQYDFIKMSLGLDLFFLRIMKEHSFFLEIAFMPKDRRVREKAGIFRQKFEQLLSDATDLANGNVSKDTINSHQAVTRFTGEAERVTEFYTGIPFNIELTKREEVLQPAEFGIQNVKTEQAVDSLNRRAYQQTAELVMFKEHILESVRSCRMFTANYPLLIEHIIREAKHYMKMLSKLSRKENIMSQEDLINQEIFWNRQMAEHAKFIAGLLDPTEETLIETANMFGDEFDELTAEAEKAGRQAMNIAGVTEKSRHETMKLQDFKAAGTKGILECKIQSIIIPLLGDHVLREANHYLCLLGVCQN